VAATGFVAALLAFLLLTAWLRTSDELRAAYPAAAILTGVALAGLLWLGVAATLAPAVLGLAERVCLAGVLGWVIAVCAVVRRR
jgi:hypothetical protein